MVDSVVRFIDDFNKIPNKDKWEKYQEIKSKKEKKEGVESKILSLPPVTHRGVSFSPMKHRQLIKQFAQSQKMSNILGKTRREAVTIWLLRVRVGIGPGRSSIHRALPDPGSCRQERISSDRRILSGEGRSRSWSQEWMWDPVKNPNRRFRWTWETLSNTMIFSCQEIRVTMSNSPRKSDWSLPTTTIRTTNSNDKTPKNPSRMRQKGNKL